MKEAPGSSETSVLTRATRRNNPEDTILHSHCRENLKSYTGLKSFYPDENLSTGKKHNVFMPYAVSEDEATTNTRKQKILAW
jgi:hypothetical protein